LSGQDDPIGARRWGACEDWPVARPARIRFLFILARQSLKVRVRDQPGDRADPIVVLGGIALAVTYFVPQGLVVLWAVSGRGPGGRIPFFDLAWYSR
jgi:hypothetical protein